LSAFNSRRCAPVPARSKNANGDPALKAQPLTLLARTPRAGAICADERDARYLALRIAGDHPERWVTSCRRAGFRP
jgi:hypothetical protein